MVLVNVVVEELAWPEQSPPDLNPTKDLYDEPGC